MTNTLNSLSPETQAYLHKGLLKRVMHTLVLNRFIDMPSSVPQGTGTKSIKWSRYDGLPLALAPLGDGTAPAGMQMTRTDITATLEQLGGIVEITDQVEDFHQHPVLKEARDQLAQMVAETKEYRAFAIMKAGTNVMYGGTGTDRATVNGPITRALLYRAQRALADAKAKPISKIIKASTSVSTEPVAEAYFCFGHTDLYADLRAITGFVDVEQYSDSDRRLPMEVGKILNFRFILSPMFTPWLAAATSSSGSTYLTNGTTGTGYPDVYPLIVKAANSFGGVSLAGKDSVSFFVKPPGEATVGNELGQKGFASCKWYDQYAILNQSHILRLEVAATQSPT